MPYRLRMFGGWALLGPDGERTEAVRPHHSKGAALLTYLAALPPGQPADRAELYPLLWPERQDRAARNALRSALSRLRRKLPEGALGGKDENRAWVDDSVLTSDVRAFGRALEDGRLRDALGLYRGPFMDHVRLTSASPFNRWADEKRDTYRRRAYEAALTIGERTRADGALDEAEHAYRRALDLAPLREDAAAGLIRVLAEQGERAEALHLYEAFTDRLERELELAPSADLRDLADRVRSEPAKGGAGTSAVDLAETAGRDESAGSRWFGRPLPVVLTLLAAVLFGAGAWLLRGGGSETTTGSSPGADRPTVAVLPFSDASTPESGENLGLAFTESIIAELALVEDLSVVPRSAVMPYRRSDLPVRAVADSLGVEHVLEGSIRQHGDSIEISVEFLRADEGRRLWAGTFEREFPEIAEVEGEVARRVAGALEARLSAQTRRRLADRPTENSDAYGRYLRGRELLVRARHVSGPRDRENLVTATELFREAIRLDSTFASAYVGLARAFRIRGELEGAGSWADSTLRAARRAVELDSTLADAHRILGRYLHIERGRISEAERHLKRAVALKPGGGWCFCDLAYLYYWAGEIPKSLRWYWEALPLAPENPLVRHGVELAMIALGEEAATRAWIDRVQALRDDPRPEMLHPFVRGHYDTLRRRLTVLRKRAPEELQTLQWQGVVAQLDGRPHEARNYYRRVHREAPGIHLWDVAVRTRLAQTLLASGRDSARAETLLRQVIQRYRQAVEQGNETFRPPVQLASAYAVLGQQERAYRWLDSIPTTVNIHQPPHDPAFRSLHGEERFDEWEERARRRVDEKRRAAMAWARERGIGWPPMPGDSPLSGG